MRWATVDPGSARVAITIGDVAPDARAVVVVPPITIEVGRRVPLAKPWTGWIRTPCENHEPEDACECVRRYRPVQHTHKREINDDDEDNVYIAIYEHLQAHAVERILVEKVGTVHGVSDAREMAAIAYDLIRTAPIARAAKDAAMALGIQREPSVTSQTWRAVVFKGVDRGEAKGAARGGHTIPAEVMLDVLRREIDGCPERPNEDERDSLAMLAYVAMRERVAKKTPKVRAERPAREGSGKSRERKRPGPTLGFRCREILTARQWIPLPELAALLDCPVRSAEAAVYRLRGVGRVTEGTAHLVGVEVPPEARGLAAGYKGKDAGESKWSQKCARCRLPRRGHVCAGSPAVAAEPAAAE